MRIEVGSMMDDAAITSDTLEAAGSRPRVIPEDTHRESPDSGRNQQRRDTGRRVAAAVDAHLHERPGVTPDRSHYQNTITLAASPESETEPTHKPMPEVIVEVAPETAPSETEPAKPAPEVIVEVAPETDPAELQPPPYQPSEVIQEIAPETDPAELQPPPYQPSEVIPEVAPEVITEIAPETAPHPYKPSEVITEIAPDVPPERRSDEPE
jgi:hypothetical protein